MSSTELGGGPRVRAPRLPTDAPWFNTGGAPLSLAELRGRFVLLDFWTSCCGNCLHVVDELRPLEDAHLDVLTVIGVHSPKFPHEAEPAALTAAIERASIRHPVLNDPQLHLWRQYTVRAWPTLVLIDPEGYVVAQAAGEGHVSALGRLVDRLVVEHEARGTLHRSPIHYQRRRSEPSTLRYPAKAVVLPATRTGRGHDSLLVADAGHHQLAELTLDGTTVLRRIGSGVRGRGDGPPTTARFAEPNGLALLPVGTAPYDVLVADTANHLLRGVRLDDGVVVQTVDLAAALRDTRTITGQVPAVASPWDVAWWPAIGRVVVAAAGVHLLLSVDPGDGRVEILAGTTVEGLRDGPALDAWLAQPSGLAVDGDQVWFVDAESSSLRWITIEGELHTAIGEGLFDFGYADGAAEQARMQHPLGVTRLGDGTLAVHDTYNGAVRRYDPASGELSTLVDGLDEPSGGVLVDGELVVVESAAHRLVRVDLPAPSTADAVPVPGRPNPVPTGPMRASRPPTRLGPGPVELTVAFEPPPGRHLDDRDGPAVRLEVGSSPATLLLRGSGESTQLTRQLHLADLPGGVLQVSVQVATCDDDGTVAHPACHLSRQDWGIPIELDPTGPRTLQLMLLA